MLFVLLFVMVKDIGRIYKHIKYQISTSSLKAPVSSSSDPQTSSAIELTTTYVPSVRDKNQNTLFLIPIIPFIMMEGSQITTP